jgi:hypothetical protein
VWGCLNFTAQIDRRQGNLWQNQIDWRNAAKDGLKQSKTTKQREAHGQGREERYIPLFRWQAAELWQAAAGK